jgi:hypothetical protein
MRAYTTTNITTTATTSHRPPPLPSPPPPPNSTTYITTCFLLSSSFHSLCRYVAAMTSLMDDIVGDVVTALKQSGLWDNTVFIWSSDNGAAIELDNGAKNAYPLKGGYYTDWEGGVRAPALVNGGVLPQKMRGQHLDGLIHISDWLPTFVVGLNGGNVSDPLSDAAGLPPVDGVNQWGYISGAVGTSPRTAVGFTPLPDVLVQAVPSRHFLPSREGANASRRGSTRLFVQNRAQDSKHSAIIVVINGSKIKIITGAVSQVCARPTCRVCVCVCVCVTWMRFLIICIKFVTN